ncbi:hypothetical protein TcWFU_003330 [Taenia crassiceps]|uniref:Secreted protein n=1 Tax=Taenia crassiceps TaxID=6207 RepID=A0ABR4Q9B1_9CEST
MIGCAWRWCTLVHQSAVFFSRTQELLGSAAEAKAEAGAEAGAVAKAEEEESLQNSTKKGSWTRAMNISSSAFILQMPRLPGNVNRPSGRLKITRTTRRAHLTCQRTLPLALVPKEAAKLCIIIVCQTAVVFASAQNGHTTKLSNEKCH